MASARSGSSGAQALYSLLKLLRDPVVGGH